MLHEKNDRFKKENERLNEPIDTSQHDTKVAKNNMLHEENKRLEKENNDVSDLLDHSQPVSESAKSLTANESEAEFGFSPESDAERGYSYGSSLCFSESGGETGSRVNSCSSRRFGASASLSSLVCLQCNASDQSYDPGSESDYSSS